MGEIFKRLLIEDEGVIIPGKLDRNMHPLVLVGNLTYRIRKLSVIYILTYLFQKSQPLQLRPNFLIYCILWGRGGDCR